MLLNKYTICTDLLYIGPGPDTTQKDDRLLGLGQLLNLVGDNKWEFRDLVDHVALAKDESRYTAGSYGRHNGVPPLDDVNATVPAPPRLGWGEHASTAAHVAKGALARTVGAAATDTGDTSDSTASTP